VQSGSLSVLILDSDVRFGTEFARALAEHAPGYEALAVSTEEEAWRLVHETGHPFDMLLVDEWTAPHSDKHTMLRLLHRFRPHLLPVVMQRSPSSDSSDGQQQEHLYPIVPRPTSIDAADVAYILETLTALQSIGSERNLLRTLNDLAEAALQARSVAEVQQIIMKGGCKLGFARVRLWMINADETVLIGAGERGNTGLSQFVGVQCPLATANYARRIVASQDPLVFDGQQYGPSFLAQHFISQGYQPPTDIWYGLALRSRDACQGVLILDTPLFAPLKRPELLPMLRLFGNQMAAALERMHLYEQEQRQRQARDQLIEANYTVMAQVYARPLHTILSQICQAAQLAMGADSVLIYPLIPGASPDSPTYEVESAGYAGLRNPFNPGAQPGRVTRDILQSGKALPINDITQTDWFQADYEQSLVRVEDFRAFIATPIYEVSTSEISGVIYINFRQPCTFTRHDIYQAESFARMAAIAILTSRAGQSMQQRLRQVEQSSMLRQRELHELHGVMRAALEPGTNEDNVAGALLQAIQSLIDQPDVQVALLLREWEERATLDQEPVRVRQKYVLQLDGTLERKVERNLDYGITGLALQSGTSQLAGDVRDPGWAPYFVPSELPNTRSELDVPIVLGTQVLGVVNTESPRLNAFSKLHKDMLERLSAAAALALDNVWRQERLHNVLLAAKAVITPFDLDETLKAVLQATTRTVPGVAIITIWYLTPEGRHLQAGPMFGVQQNSPVQREISNPDSVVWRVMQSPEPIWVADVSQEPRLDGNFTGREHISSVAAFPLRTGDAEDTPIGAMFFNYRLHHDFTAEEKVLLPIIAAITAASIRDAIRLTEMQVAMDIIDAVGLTLDLEETLSKILVTLKRRFFHSYVGVYTYNQEERLLTFAPASRSTYWPDYDQRVDTLPIAPDNLEDDQGRHSIVVEVARRTLQKGEPQFELIPDVQHNPVYRVAHPQARSLLCLTMMQEGQLLGALVLENAEPAAFDDSDVTLIRKASSQIGLAIERSRRSEQLRFSTTIATSTIWAAEIAHDVNSEVGQIRNRVYWLASEAGLSDEGKQHVHEIDESAHRLAIAAKLVDKVANDHLLLDDWIGDIIRDIVQRHTCNSPINLDFMLGCPDVYVQASGVLLQRVLRHLVRNALDAMGNTGDLLIVTRRRDQRYVEVQVVDSGPGIDEYTRSKLFKVPFSTKTSADPVTDTRGQGLLFVRWMVELMGGTIYITPPPTPAYRTAFSFTLPVATKP
jgi:GAF domain-containing protein